MCNQCIKITISVAMQAIQQAEQQVTADLTGTLDCSTKDEVVICT